MHIVIDKANLTFLPIKHESVFVVCDLVYLEAPNAHSYICPLDNNFLKHFTDLELMLLYKNTTDEQAMRVGDSLRNILFELATRIPVRTVNSVELNAQCLIVPPLSSKRYVYQPSVIRPLEKDALFKLAPVKLPKATNEIDVAKNRAQAPTGPATPAPPAPVATATPSAPSAPQQTINSPRKGGIREIIWTVADSMWEKAGSPKDTASILSLRKKIMQVLESDYNVKKTSSSNELGQWNKARVL